MKKPNPFMNMKPAKDGKPKVGGKGAKPAKPFMPFKKGGGKPKK